MCQGGDGGGRTCIVSCLLFAQRSKGWLQRLHRSAVDSTRLLEQAASNAGGQCRGTGPTAQGASRPHQDCAQNLFTRGRERPEEKRALPCPSLVAPFHWHGATVMPRALITHPPATTKKRAANRRRPWPESTMGAAAAAAAGQTTAAAAAVCALCALSERRPGVEAVDWTAVHGVADGGGSVEPTPPRRRVLRRLHTMPSGAPANPRGTCRAKCKFLRRGQRRR